MTPQENQVLQTLLTQLTQAHVAAKDSDAQAMIETAVARQPDAAYLLVQRTLLLERALQQAKSQLAQLQEQRNSAGGGAWNQAWPPATAAPPTAATPPAQAPPQPQATQPPQATLPPQATPSPQATPPPQATSTSTGWGGFLGSAATTAAGVAGGNFLFQGLEGLFGHHGGGSGGGGFLGGNGPTETVENITVNEYSGDPGLSGSARADDAYFGDERDDADASRFGVADDSDGGLDEDDVDEDDVDEEDVDDDDVDDDPSLA
jgi:uncharacterized protein